MSKDNLMSKQNLTKIEENKKNNEKQIIIEEKSHGQLSLEKNKGEILKNPKKNSWIRLQKNYHLENDLLIRDVVPGPFKSTKLIQLAPFVLNSLQRKTFENEKIRRGIPNRFEIVHSTQGIPDPWKVIFSENDFYPEENEAEEEAEICLCEPNLEKEEENQVKFPISCGGLRRKIKRKLKRKRRKKEKMQKCCEIFEKIATNSQLLKCNVDNNKETRNFACNTDFPGECESKDEISQNQIESSGKIIHCEINGKITFRNGGNGGESINGIGSMKFNCVGENRNDVVIEKHQREENQCPSGFYQNFCNQFSKTLKFRNIITNIEQNKQFSKLKKALNGKKCEQIETDFGNEKKLICYKCSCPYLRVLNEKNLSNDNFSQERKLNSRSKGENEKKKNERKLCQMKCDDSTKMTIKKNERKKEKQKNSRNKLKKDVNSMKNLKHVKVNDDTNEKKDLDDKVQCDCEIKHTEDNTDSGNNADISQLSKNDNNNLSSRESTLTQMTSSSSTLSSSVTQLNKKSPSKINDKKELKIIDKKQKNLCSPCGKIHKNTIRSNEKNNYNADLNFNFTDKLLSSSTSSTKKSGRRKLKSQDTVQSYQTENYKKSTKINENDDDLVVENLSNNSNIKLPSIASSEKNRKSRERFSNDYYRKRGGGEKHEQEEQEERNEELFDFWSSDFEKINIPSNQHEIRKTKNFINNNNKNKNNNSWFIEKENENSEDSLPKKIISNNKKQTNNDEDCDEKNNFSDREFSISTNNSNNNNNNKIYSSFLEESLDLISEPIGRRKILSDDSITTSSERKSRLFKNDVKCYTKYCYERSQNYHGDY